MDVCLVHGVYHYMLGDESALASILKNGLLPLSSFPSSARWRLVQERLPGFFEELYTVFAEPVVQKPYKNFGIFLTPIDFRLLPDAPLAACTRIRVPISAIDPAEAALTYELCGERVVLPLNPDTLAQVRDVWSDELVRAWFGKDPTKQFFYVPQVVTYQGCVHIKPEWVELPDAPVC